MFHGIHAASGFPSPSEVEVISRENTGNGRYVGLRSTGAQPLKDGHYDLGGRYIEIEGVPHGMMAVARAANGRLVEIEIAAYGGYGWDGVERSWSIK